ncbi:hypothetical protein [Saccharothrix lopnurensis]|uniref:Uncharacterized protein n=1 Tax=Saccharothrix lopnurensis TaxID=1670621 RepID=A0ABW1NZZ2_9PSEU
MRPDRPLAEGGGATGPTFGTPRVAFEDEIAGYEPRGPRVAAHPGAVRRTPLG